MPLSISVRQPLEGAHFVFQRLAPRAPGGTPQVRISLAFEIANPPGDPQVVIDRIEIGGQVVSNQLDAEEAVGLPSRRTLAPGAVLTYQNHLGAAANGDVKEWFRDIVVLDEPAPKRIAVRVFGNGESQPLAERTVLLLPGGHQGRAMSWPGSEHDMRDNDAWLATSDHPADFQAFALDVLMGVYGNGALSLTYPVELEPGRRESYRAYGQPVYAMDDGTVHAAVNDQSEWDGPDDDDPDEDPEGSSVSPTAGAGGGGNHIWVRSDGRLWLLAHLQRGSIPRHLVKKGAAVKRGQYLGKVGYSGNSGSPHFHAEVKTVDAAGEPAHIRPMVFDDVWATPNDGAFDPWSPSRWTRLVEQSVPDTHSALVPGTSAPAWDKGWADERQYFGVWHPGDHIELHVVRPGFDAFLAAFEFLTAEHGPNHFRLRALETYSENGRRSFIGTFRDDAGGAHFVSRFHRWEDFEDDVQERHGKGWELVDMCSWVEGDTFNYVGVFGEGAGGRQPGRYSSVEDLKADVDARAKKGQQLVAIDALPFAGNCSWMGVFRSRAAKADVIHDTTWQGFTGEWSQHPTKRLADLAIAEGVYVGVLEPDAAGTGQILEGHTGYGCFTQRRERVAYDGWRLARVAVERT